MKKLITVETIDMNGPSEVSVSKEEAITLINAELRNNKTIYVNGTPIVKDSIVIEDIAKAKTITIMNKLVGG